MSATAPLSAHTCDVVADRLARPARSHSSGSLLVALSGINGSGKSQHSATMRGSRGRPATTGTWRRRRDPRDVRLTRRWRADGVSGLPADRAELGGRVHERAAEAHVLMDGDVEHGTGIVDPEPFHVAQRENGAFGSRKTRDRNLREGDQGRRDLRRPGRFPRARLP